jgi:predicted kinase
MNAPWSQRLAQQAWPDSFIIPAPGASLAQWEGPACALFPDLADRLAATPQDEIFHAEGDVWTHTKMVVQALLDDPDYAKQDLPSRGVAFYAALLHDISKPETTREQDGRIIAPGHSPRGAIAARIALWEHDVPFALREQVCRLIEAHQVPFFAFSNRRGIPADFTARQLAADRSVDLLCLLAAADMRGRICQDQAKILDEIALFREQAAELDCLHAPYAFPDAPTRMAYLLSEGTRYADEPVFVDRPFQVTLLSGLPASGKNTWLARNAHLPVIAYDDLRTEFGFKPGEGTGTLVHAADDRMRVFLRAREPFVVNATHLSRQMRSRTLDLVRRYGGQVRVVYLEAPRAEILARNQARDSTLDNKKLLRMASRWEVPGFDEVEELELQVQGVQPIRRRSPTA